MVSMTAIWDDTVAFIRRETGLLVPLALATLFIANVAQNLLAPVMRPGNGLAGIGIIAFGVWAMLGRLAISALVVRSGLSVGEAVALGARRLPVMIGVALLFILAASIALTPVAVGMVQSGINLEEPTAFWRDPPPWAVFYMALLLAIAIWLYLRFAVLRAVIVDRKLGVFASIRESFAMTRGTAGKLLAVLLLYGVVAFVLGRVVQWVFGSVFALVGRATGSAFLGDVLTALAVGLLAAAFAIVETVFVSFLYRRLSSGT